MFVNFNLKKKKIRPSKQASVLYRITNITNPKNVIFFFLLMIDVYKIHIILKKNSSPYHFCFLGLVWHKQEGDAQPELGLQEVRDETEATLHCKFLKAPLET